MTRKAPVLALILLAAVLMHGCEKKGPAEKAGERIDDTMSEALDKAEEAGEKIQDAAKETREKIEEASQ
jgi:hypothetical protein